MGGLAALCPKFSEFSLLPRLILSKNTKSKTTRRTRVLGESLVTLGPQDGWPRNVRQKQAGPRPHALAPRGGAGFPHPTPESVGPTPAAPAPPPRAGCPAGFNKVEKERMKRS